ncbi:MAG: 39S ribosomal protein L45 [Desulfovibrio sp.]|jgi:hypothetical protein|nr:39S ribosomal protein L45 [Desulfovibrio sp.]
MRKYSSFFLPVFFLFCLLGAPLAATAAEDEASLTERLFAGSFTGSLLFGYPYTGAGAADMAAVAVLALVALRLVHAGRSRGNGEDRFTVDGNPGPSGPVDTDRGGAGRDGEEAGGGKNGDGARERGSRDNVWSRRMGGGAAEENGSGGPDVPRSMREDARPRATARQRAEAMWGYLSSDPEKKSAEAPAEVSVAPGVVLPDGFDAADFLQGARTLYVRLQKAWASRDISALTPFVTPEMLDVLRKQAERNPKPVKTDIVMIEAELKDVRSEGETQTAQTAFNVLMRTGAEPEATEVAELWTFARGPESQGMWRLSAIGGA